MAQTNGVKYELIPIKKIKLGKNSRMDIQTEDLADLMLSIKEMGLLEPIGVTTRGANYEVCYGNRRFLACDKLGLKAIPAVIHDNLDEKTVDIQNLTENVQRRNISLPEVGRYVKLLMDDGMGRKEIAVRLGVAVAYVDSCIEAYERVPLKYRNDIAVRNGMSGSQESTAGKISIRQAIAINSVKSRNELSNEEVDKLYQAAKKMGPQFMPSQVSKYVAAMRAGKRLDQAIEDFKNFTYTGHVTIDEYNRLYRKYVADGPFKSMRALLRAIFRGEVKEKVEIL